MKKGLISPRRNTTAGKSDQKKSSDRNSTPQSPRNMESPRGSVLTSPRKSIFSGLSPRKNKPSEEKPSVLVVEPFKSLNLKERVSTARQLLEERLKALQGKPAVCLKAKAEIQSILYDLKMNGLNTQTMKELASLNIVPLCDFFTDEMLLQLSSEPVINLNHPLLQPINELIYQLQNLLGEFSFTDEVKVKDLQRLYNPLKELCKYYSDGREEIINAQSPQERLAAVAVDVAYIFGDSFEICELDKGAFLTSGENALAIICRNKDGITVREIAEGTRAVFIRYGLVMKANPIGKDYNDPEKEKALGTWYQLHSPILCIEGSQPVLVAAPSESIKLLHVPLNQNSLQKEAIQLLTIEYFRRLTMERMAQVGYQFDGNDFQLVLEALCTFFTWKIYIDKNELIEHLTSLEKIAKLDEQLSSEIELSELSTSEKKERLKSRPLLNFKSWPIPLLLHSGIFDERFTKFFVQSTLPSEVLTQNPDLLSSILSDDSEILLKLKKGEKAVWHKLLTNNSKVLHLLITAYPKEFNNFIEANHDYFYQGLKNSLSKFPKVFNDLFYNYSPETAYNELLTILSNINKPFYSRFCIANMPVDPSDLTALNLRFISRFLQQNKREHFLCTFDSDNALEYPVTRKTIDQDGNYVTFPTTKCVLYLLPNFKETIDKEVREEFLTHTPLNYVLDWCYFLFKFDQEKREKIIKQLITQKDVFEGVVINPNEKNRVEAVLQNLNRILHISGTSLRIPDTLTLYRLPDMFESYEKLESDMLKDPNLTHFQAYKSIRPANAIYLEKVCFPKLEEENPFRGILEALRIINSKEAPSFEQLFLGEKITIMVKENLGEKFNPEYMDAITQYNILLSKQKSAEKQPENPLPSMETLRKECMIQELNNISLHDLLEPHNHSADDLITDATLTIKKAIKLFLRGIDFAKKYYETGKISQLLHYLNRIGLEFPFVKLNCFSEEQFEHLLWLAATNSLPGVIKLIKNSTNKLYKLDINGESLLHCLLRNHRHCPSQDFLDTLELCLMIKCDPEQLDKQNKTPLMHFIENADPNNLELANKVIICLKSHRAELNQRTRFQKQGVVEQNTRPKYLIGTPVDYAIDCNNPSLVLALLQNGATDFVDMETALEFSEVNRHHDKYKKCVELLCYHPRFAAMSAINEFSTTQPDEQHPPQCMIQGARHGKRYFLKTVWDQLFYENGDIKRTNSVTSGAHIVIPLSKESYDFCLWSKLQDNNPQNAERNKIYISEKGQYCVIGPDGIIRQDSFPNNNFDFPKLFKFVKTKKKLSHKEVVAKKQLEYKALFLMAERKQVFPFPLHVKFFPEFPLVQRLYELITERLGCPGTHSELWRSNKPDEKQSIPLLMINTIMGESYTQIDPYPKKLQELLQTLDRRLFSLQAFITILIPQEDGHADQYKVSERENRRFFVNIDPDRACGPRLIWDGNQKKVVNKDIFYLLQAFKEVPLDLDAITTIICANGKRLPSVAMSQAEAEIFIRENAGLFFDEIFHEVMTEERLLQELFPRDAISKAVTSTTSEVIQRDKENPLPAALRQTFDKLEKPAEIQDQKTIEPQKRKKSVFGIIRDRDEQFTVIDCPYEKRTFSDLYELYVKIALYLYTKSRSEIYPDDVFSEHFKELHQHYNSRIKQNPNMSTCQIYLLFNDGNPRTLSTQKDMIDGASQQLSTRFINGLFCNSAETLIEFYHQAKRSATEVVTVVHKIEVTAIPSPTFFRNEKHFENFLRCIQWSEKKSDNRSMLNALLKIQRELQFQLYNLYISNCPNLTWDDLKHLVQYSPRLEKAELVNCTGLMSPLGKSIFSLFEDYTPTIKKLVISNTDVTHFEYDGSKLSSLTQLEAQNCLLLKNARFINPQLHSIDFSGSKELNDIKYTYTKDFSLTSPLEEERPLKDFILHGCSALKPECIEAVIEASPFLQKLGHDNTASFNPRAFLSFSFMQHRFCQNTLEAMLQNGTLILPQLIDDHQLMQISQWLKLSNNTIKITEINFLSAKRLSQTVKLQFILGINPLPRIIEPGPYRDKRTQGRGYEWDIGLSTVSAVEELPSGNIFAVGHKKVASARGPSSTLYGIRSPIRTNHGDYETFGTLDDRRKDRFTGECVSFNKNIEVVGSTVMPDGTVLLSDRSNQLYRVDTVSQCSVALHIPLLKSYCGDLLSLEHNIFALHSDGFYIITHDHGKWNIKFKAPDLPQCHPIINGPDNLVAFCSAENQGVKISVMNYHNGITLFTQTFSTRLIKPLCFLNKKELLICNGEATHDKVILFGNLKKTIKQHSISIINIETCQITVFNSDFTLTGNNISSITATQTHCGEILITGLGTHNQKTLALTSRCSSETKIRKSPIICHQNDNVTLSDNEQNPVLEMSRNKHHILDPQLHHQYPEQFDIAILNEGEIIVKITAPEAIVRSELDIDLSSNKAWFEKICHNQPTGTTLFDLLSAFFEKTAIENSNERSKQNVTCQDNIIFIKGLSEKEAKTLRRVLKSFWQHPLSPTASPTFYRPVAPHPDRAEQSIEAEQHDQGNVYLTME